MFFGKMALILAILPKNISKVNDNITTDSLSINDLLESIKFLTRSIIARKHKKFIWEFDDLIIGKSFNTRTGGWGKCYIFRTTSPPKKSPLQKSLAFEFLNLTL